MMRPIKRMIIVGAATMWLLGNTVLSADAPAIERKVAKVSDKEGAVYFGQFKGDGLYLSLSGNGVTTCEDALTITNLVDRLDLSVAILNGYPRDVLVNCEPEVVFHGARVECFDKDNNSLSSQGLGGPGGVRLLSHQRYIYLAGSGHIRTNGCPSAYEQNLTLIFSWKQGLKFVTDHSDSPPVLYWEPKPTQENNTEAILDKETEQLSITATITIEYFIVGEKDKFRQKLNFCVNALRRKTPDAQLKQLLKDSPR